MAIIMVHLVMEFQSKYLEALLAAATVMVTAIRTCDTLAGMVDLIQH